MRKSKEEKFKDLGKQIKIFNNQYNEMNDSSEFDSNNYIRKSNNKNYIRKFNNKNLISKERIERIENKFDKKITKAYNKLEHKYDYERNNKYLRKTVVSDLTDELKGEEIYFDIECDEGNNPPDVMNNGSLIVKIIWKDTQGDIFNGRNLVFGNPWNIS